MTSVPFERVAGLCAMVVAMSGFLYAFAFTAVNRVAPAAGLFLGALFLMVGGLLTTVVEVALYQRLRQTDGSWALLAFVLGIMGAMGAVMHAGYDLANAINPPNLSLAGIGALPNQVDPRGLLTFGVAGSSLVIVAWLIRRDLFFPRGLGTLGYVLAFFFVLLYLGRLTILSPTHPLILVSALLSGFLVGPAWYGWLGIVFQNTVPSRPGDV
jgi:hypothetical protein